MKSKLVFLKLGGSLITVKDQPHTPRLDVIERLAQEIAAARSADPGLQILLGHGSGSYGHVPASQFHTRQGVKTRSRMARVRRSVAPGGGIEPSGDGRNGKSRAPGARIPAFRGSHCL